jgi:DNA-binding MarR family transcriptional regulator
MKKNASEPPKLSWEEIGVIVQGLSFASRPFWGITKGITAEYALGPRGAWILRLIESGQVLHPLDVTNFFKISRSVISDELARLSERRLIVYRQSKQDGRRVELALTPRGEELSARVRQEITKLVNERFSLYSRETMLQFGRMLHDFIFPAAKRRPRLSARKRASKKRVSNTSK